MTFFEMYTKLLSINHLLTILEVSPAIRNSIDQVARELAARTAKETNISTEEVKKRAEEIFKKAQMNH